MNALSKTALVTGAARGIGLAIASRFAADGARVALLDLDGAAADAVAKTVGGGARAIAADVTKAAEIDFAVKRVVDAWGRLDILVNNAGIIHSDVSTTMTYTHIRDRGPAGVRSPADRMFLS